MGARHIVLACNNDILWEVLNQAQQIGLVTQQVGLPARQHYRLTICWLRQEL